MRVEGQITFSPIETLVFYGLCFYIIWRGRPEIGLGPYLSMSLWGRPVIAGPIAYTWPLMAAIILAALRYIHCERRLSFHPERIDTTINSIFPSQGRWIIIWMIFWWAWALTGLMLFKLPDKVTVYRPILILIIFGFLIGLLVANDLRRVKAFAISYLITAILGGWLALQKIDVTFSYLLQDPTISNVPVLNMGLRNYHFFSHQMGIAFIMAVVLFLQAKRLSTIALSLIGAGLCAYFLLLVGARQSISAAGVVLFTFVFWAFSRKNKTNARVVAFTVSIGVLVFLIYQVAPHLIVREGESDLNDSFNVFADRGELWLIGWNYFLSSPIWGLGFEQKIWSHNLFIGTLADQGLVGMIFFIGFLSFVAYLIPTVITQAPDDPRALWRMAFFGVFLFGLVHGQGSGNTMTTAHLHWSIGFLWMLSEGSFVRPKIHFPNILSSILRPSPQRLNQG